ncbi:flavin reductase family protein [Actinoplanes sp. LDG1-06]|uniref:Flavin reductase family protein n=1 Tax=Paractinoplanes ovalisporus TaxID=2810368 RepID=A0ABS2A405_9ACTN|nr:flavin reductase family protein [Actinoplanes ovalisporus]
MNGVESDLETGVGERFRAAFRRYPTGVAIISAAGPVGLTASSVASVSLDPPALSFSVMGSPSAQALVRAPSFVVNLLGPDSIALARAFAGPGGPRFTPDQGWDYLPSGEPVLTSASASLRGIPLQLVPVGTSTVVIAEIVDVLLGEPGGHLVYHDRDFIASPRR